MRTLGEVARDLHRCPVYLAGLQKRFTLPVLEGAAYSTAYFAFLRVVITLRTFNIGEEPLLDLWHLEKKLPHVRTALKWAVSLPKSTQSR